MNNRLPQPGNSHQSTALFIAVGTILSGMIVYLAVLVGHTIAGDALPTKDFWEVFFGVLSRDVTWHTASTIVVVAAAAVIAIIVIIVCSRPMHKKSSRVDRSAQWMGRGEDISPLTQRAVTQKAQRLGVQSATPGVAIGCTLSGKVKLFGSWEDMHLDIWGPRTGKTSSRAIPAILDAPGPVLVTSNKRDVVDITAKFRGDKGSVWIFDPQGVAESEPSWYWDPLSYVEDDEKAMKLAALFAATSRSENAERDFFETAGEQLLGGYLLAAALDNRPITDVYLWLSRPTNDDARDILKRHDYPMIVNTVEAALYAPEEQRGGVYATAQKMVRCLTVAKTAQWVTKPSKDSAPKTQFSPQDFILGTRNSLYSLSKEGGLTASPLVAALTMAVIEAAEVHAVSCPGGRLQVPLVGVLDEAANVCPWPELPDLYSHYGSRGIVLMTILQSWAQGVSRWGETGMQKLWSASNVKVYGGGVSDVTFLRDLSNLIGEHDKLSRSVSVSKGSRTTSTQINKESILTVDELAALPQGRAVVLASGCRPTLIRTTPWYEGAHAEVIAAQKTSEVTS